jgi:hypothetical protein
MQMQAEMVTYDVHPPTKINAMCAKALDARVQFQRIAIVRPRLRD